MHLKKISPGLVIGALFWVFATLTLTLPTGCGTLSGTGVYGKDKFLYGTDQTLATSYDFLHAFVTWEYQQRGNLAEFPEVAKSADYVRGSAPKWFADAGQARAAYLAAKLVITNALAVPAAQSNLQAAVSVIQAESATIDRTIKPLPVPGKPSL